MMKAFAKTNRWPIRALCVLLAMGTVSYAANVAASGGRDEERDATMAEQSRDAGLLTDWHLIGRYGQVAADFSHRFAPERQAAEAAAREAKRNAARRSTAAAASQHLPGRDFPSQAFETVFPEGRFVLPKAAADQKGVFYAVSCVFLSDSGEWNVYLESPGEAVIFIDGSRVLTRHAKQTGAQRETIQAGSGYHLVMVKFLAQSAPFRVAILPPNSGSRHKNSTPHFGGSENLNALLRAPRFAASPLL